MEVIHGIDHIERQFRNPVLTIGNFDGVHIGHKSLFQRVKQVADSLGGESLVMTFDPHPIKVLYPGNGPPLITPHEQKVELIEGEGLDALIVVDFTRELAKMTAHDFVRVILYEKIGARAVVVGPDYRFGHKRQGDIPYLQQLGRKLGFQVHVVTDLTIDGNAVSSSAIRELILAGELQKARGMLGRDYQVSGHVVEGRDRGGRLLGFPTANLKLIDELTPKPGVYATEVFIDGERHEGATNIGYSPTFKDGAFSVETHIIDFSGDIYGKIIQVCFVERIRDEKAFSGPEELAAQIHKDVQRAREILSRHLAESEG
ncbi:MAG: bifunctional riboflavin kinase/FAD synthetase [Deltaproteobacteria bacterium]|nr:MAG: bifunctional riboflavin kinase/FAD synthetase [Deltaproteobacteria bacterium]